MTVPGEPVGRVAELWRYPVKSMAGQALQEADVSWDGLAGDRRWAFVQDALPRSGFPWLTIRERAALWHYQPAFAEPGRPNASRTIIHTPSGAELDVVDPALAAELGGGVRAIKHDRGVFDASPLSLITTQSVTRLGELVGSDLDVRRFRPNLVVEAADGAPFLEDDWVGCVLHIGEMAMRVDLRDQRCVMVNIDPDTTDRDTRVLRAIAQERDACLGAYGSVVKPGRVEVGDPVVLTRHSN